jgi:hypothetical protein
MAALVDISLRLELVDDISSDLSRLGEREPTSRRPARGWPDLRRRPPPAACPQLGSWAAECSDMCGIFAVFGAKGDRSANRCAPLLFPTPSRLFAAAPAGRLARRLRLRTRGTGLHTAEPRRSALARRRASRQAATCRAVALHAAPAPRLARAARSACARLRGRSPRLAAAADPREPQESDSEAGEAHRAPRPRLVVAARRRRELPGAPGEPLSRRRAAWARRAGRESVRVRARAGERGHGADLASAVAECSRASPPNLARPQRLAIVSPDTGNNTVEGGTGDQPLFTKARRGAAAQPLRVQAAPSDACAPRCAGRVAGVGCERRDLQPHGTQGASGGPKSERKRRHLTLRRRLRCPT